MTQRIKIWLSSGVGGVAIITALFVFTTWPRDVLQLPLIRNEQLRQTDVIVVLGAGTRKKDENHLPPQAEQRLYAGGDLYFAGVSQKIIVAGGKSPVTGDVEADRMAEALAKNGITNAAIVRERSSRDTWQNAERVKAIMNLEGWKTATVVTSPYHTWRACRMFRKQGVDITCVSADYALVPAQDVYNKFMDNRAVVREYGAIILAWLQGRL